MVYKNSTTLHSSEKAARLFDRDRLWEDDIIKSLKGY